MVLHLLIAAAAGAADATAAALFEVVLRITGTSCASRRVSDWI